MKSSLNIFILFSSLAFCFCAVKELNDETFVDHISVGNHLVAFYAPWCDHCIRLAPVWNKLAAVLENNRSVSISRVDCVFHRSICDKFGVHGVPTLLWIVDGKEIDHYDGEHDVEEFKAYIDDKTTLNKIEESSEYEKTSEISFEQSEQSAEFTLNTTSTTYTQYPLPASVRMQSGGSVCDSQANTWIIAMFLLMFTHLYR